MLHRSLLLIAILFAISSLALADVAKNDAPGSLKKGNELLDTGKYEDAVAYFNGIGEQSSLKREPYRLLGLSTALVETGKYDDAIVTAQKAVDLKKDLSGAWNNIADAQARSGKRADAVVTYRRGIAILKSTGADTAKLETNLAELQAKTETNQAAAPATPENMSASMSAAEKIPDGLEYSGPIKSHWGENADVFIRNTLGLSDDGSWTRYSNEFMNELFRRTGQRGKPGVLLNDDEGTTWRFTTNEKNSVVEVVAMNYRHNVAPIASAADFNALVRRYTDILGAPSLSKSQQRVQRAWVSADGGTLIKLELPDEDDEWIRANMPDPYPTMTITLTPNAPKTYHPSMGRARRAITTVGNQ